MKGRKPTKFNKPQGQNRKLNLRQRLDSIDSSQMLGFAPVEMRIS